MTTTVTRVAQRSRRGTDAYDMIRDRKPFVASALSGSTDVRGGTWNCGRLPAEFLHEWMTAEPHLYVVWSWATPIAWVTAEGKIVRPDTRYSVTTSSKHHPATFALTEGR